MPSAARSRARPGVHVAILLRPYLDAILDGRKTIEARLTRTRSAPFRAVRRGDVIYLKQSSGPVRAVARAGRVLSFENLEPPDVARLRAEYDHFILGRPDYWRAKRDARCATLIWLVGPRAIGPRDAVPDFPPSNGRAWIPLSRPAPHSVQRGRTLPA